MKKKLFRNFGLAFINKHKLGYGYKHGFGYKWLPYFIQKIIINIWNFIACRIFGHDWFVNFDPKEGATWALENRRYSLKSFKNYQCSSCGKSIEKNKLNKK